MSNLRSIVQRHVEEQTLRDFLEHDFETTSENEKQRLLGKLHARGEIDREIRKILRAFLDEIEEGSPQKKKKLVWDLVLSFVNVGCSIALAYAVNLVNWPFVISVFIAQVVINGLYIAFRDK